MLIDWLVVVTRPATAPLSLAQIRTAGLVSRMQAIQSVGLVASTSLNEMLHFVLKTRYRAELPNYRADLLTRYPNVRRHDWKHLHKARSDLIKQFAPGLDQVRALLAPNNLVFLQPDDLGDIPSGRTLDDELVRTMERYELDSSDAAILVEARRAGVAGIAIADRDMQRARLDFEVYTWL